MDYKKTSNILYIAAACCYIASAIYFCTKERSMGAMWLCIGSCNLCSAAALKSKSNDSDKNDKQN